jgi:predicted transcriptional regulator
MTTDINKDQTKALRGIVAGCTDASSYDGRNIRGLVSRGLVKKSKSGTKVTATAKGKKALN